MKRAIILMTRVPYAGATKTRLMTSLSGEACADLHKSFLEDYFRCFAAMEGWADCFIAYAPEHACELFFQSLPKAYPRFAQRGANIGERMHHAFERVFGLGYDSVVLVGCDAPGLQPKDYQAAFEALFSRDMVVSPTYDGGYCLIGLREKFAPLFINTVRWGGQRVIDRTICIAKDWGRSTALLKVQRDIDVEEDLAAFLEWVDQDRHDRNFYPVSTMRFIEEVLKGNESRAQGGPGKDPSISAKQQGLPSLVTWPDQPSEISGPRGVQRKLSG